KKATATTTWMVPTA
nr:Chain D, Lethal(3)malignant brain tumor-like protein 3 [Homo sapiens]